MGMVRASSCVAFLPVGVYVATDEAPGFFVVAPDNGAIMAPCREGVRVSLGATPCIKTSDNGRRVHTDDAPRVDEIQLSAQQC
jgi:hypothetical protein